MALYEKELHHALLTLTRASIATTRVFNTITPHNSKSPSNTQTIVKSDTSPVTSADFASQALIISSLRHAFPHDEIIAEEESSQLETQDGVLSNILDVIRHSKLDDAELERDELGTFPDDDAEGKSQILTLLDAGKSLGGRGPGRRIWTIDPIDGTKGFLRRGQYALCLALIVDGVVKVGALSCPNLPVDDNVSLDEHDGENVTKGVLFSAVEGQGAMARPLTKGMYSQGHEISMRHVEDITQAVFCEGVEGAHSNHSDHADIAKELGITKKSVRLDSQAKYASIARGARDIYLRLMVKADYREKIWDHAAGDLIVREAGGMVTDSNGKRLDFGLGRDLGDHPAGIVAAPLNLHSRVLKAVQTVLARKK